MASRGKLLVCCSLAGFAEAQITKGRCVALAPRNGQISGLLKVILVHLLSEFVLLSRLKRNRAICSAVPVNGKQPANWPAF
jgi:hypothetical protein